MAWWQSIVLGIVEGLTEFLPVSSTGHLILAQRALKIVDNDAARAYAICIQAGAILAVFGLYFHRVRSGLRGLLGRDPEGLRLDFNLLAGFLPAAFFGLLLHKVIKEKLFGLKPIVAAWFVGGVVILVVAWWRRGQTPAAAPQRGYRRPGTLPPEKGRGITELTLTGAVVIGLFQCLGMWPGTSRSLVTILGGLAVGLSLSAAVEFSFLLGVVTLLAATGYEAYKEGRVMLEAYSLPSLTLGFCTAGLAAAATVVWMVHYLRRHGLAVFGYYRIALAAVVAVLLVLGWLAPYIYTRRGPVCHKPDAPARGRTQARRASEGNVPSLARRACGRLARVEELHQGRDPR